MKKNYKFFLLIAVSYIVFFLTSCGGKNKNYYGLKQIHPYLHEITFNDYREDVDLESIDNMEAFGCSSVRNGNFYGRNFDFIFNDVPEFVVRVKAKKGRHASIGIATHFGLRENQLVAGKYDRQLELIPNFTLDGINDCGVICSHNVVPYNDIPEITGTNPSGKKLHMLMIPRFVLDNASSADEAVELLKQRNIYGSLHKEEYLHIMIADANKTYVVEFLDNKVVAQEKTGNKQVMTNYYLNTPEPTEHSLGIERFQILSQNYDEGNSLAGMRKLLSRVRYSNFYRRLTNPKWLSECNPQSLIKKDPALAEKKYDEAISVLGIDYWNDLSNDLRNPANPLYWITVHNSTYDMEKRMLRVSVQEDYGNYYDYYLSDVK